MPIKNIQAPVADFFALILFSAFALRFFLDKFRKKRRTDIAITLNGSAFPYFILFLFAGLLSLINVPADNLAGSFKYLLRPIFFFYLMWLFLPVAVIETKKTLERVAHIMLGAGAVAGVFGWLPLIFGDATLYNLRRLTPGALWGVAPLTFNHNILAEALVLAVPLALYFFNKTAGAANSTDIARANGIVGENSIGAGAANTANVISGANENSANAAGAAKKYYFLLFVFLIITALLTFSRAGWIALLAEVITYFWLVRTNFKSAELLKKTGAIALLLSPFIIYMIIFSASSIATSSNTTRWDMTQIAWLNFSRHPLIGNGVGTFTTLLADTRQFTVEYGNTIESHGVIQKLISETGLLGLVAFFLFVYGVIAKLYPLAKSGKEGGLGMFLFLGFIGSLIFQLFNTSYFNQHLWLVAGVGLAAAKILKKDDLA